MARPAVKKLATLGMYIVTVWGSLSLIEQMKANVSRRQRQRVDLPVYKDWDGRQQIPVLKDQLTTTGNSRWNKGCMEYMDDVNRI
jgi:hypothetical protein